MVTRQVPIRYSGIMGNDNISCWKGVCRQVDLHPPVVYRPRVFIFVQI